MDTYGKSEYNNNVHSAQSLLNHHQGDYALKVSVVAENCAGEGICEADAPDVFEVVDGLAVPKMEDIPEDLQEQVRTACDNCPTAAIIIEE